MLTYLLPFLGFLGFLALLAWAAYLLYQYELGKPSYKCLHEFNSLKVLDTDYRNVYLHTCQKCGLQRETNHSSY